MPETLRAAMSALAPLAVTIVAVVVAGWCLTLPWTYGGWFSLVPGLVLYTGVCVVHFLAHLRAARGIASRPHLLPWIVISHLTLIVAFLLQWDTGDGPEWLIVRAMTGTGPGYSDSSPPVWWPSGGLAIVLNLALFVPVVAAWRKVRRASA